jgi:glutaminyl-tRNA synthetase
MSYSITRRRRTVADEANDTVETPTNFIRNMIDEQLEQGLHDEIVTRFPPEPNGYLHIGHAKSIVLNFGIANDYDGRCHLRFDDTNPLTEDTEYVESMKEDIKWLGYDWGEHLYFASDYFERMYELAEKLVKKGKAYVDSLSTEEIREYRGSLSEPGTPSPYRDRSVEENLEMLRKMRAGEYEDGEHVLRAKIDMENPNILMRDPLIYRIRHATHHNTGDEWCIYPMYDYAHCLEDAFENITHSLCTLEFENNRELYDWFIEETEVEANPRQTEFARLSLNYTIMSKRKLRRLVEEGHVAGWDDPRMPTLAGLRRRGVPPAAIRNFMNMIGVAKANSTVDFRNFEYAIRDYLNMRAPRVLSVLDPVKVVVENYPEDKVEWLDADYYPRDVPKEDTRKVPFTRELYIERDDFREDPPEGFYRLSPGAEVRLRYGYFITCEEVVKDEDGNVTELICSYDPETRGGDAPDGRNPDGTIHWVSATESVPVEVRAYDRLFNVPHPDAEEGVDFVENLNPDSLILYTNAHIEPSVLEDDEELRYQFERQGYFWRDPVVSTPDEVVFNQIVPLKDTWARKEKERRKAEQERRAREKAEQKRKAKEGNKKDKPNKKPASYERDMAREEHPELAARLEAYQEDFGLDYDDADLLSGSFAAAEFYEGVLDDYDSPDTVAKWIVNEMRPELKEHGIEGIEEADLDASEIATLIEMFDQDRITNQISREVLAKMIETGKDPETIVDEEGLERITDESSLEPVIEDVMAEQSDNVDAYAGGKTQLFGFFIGQVMQKTGGTADPGLVRSLLQKMLPEPAEDED